MTRRVLIVLTLLFTTAAHASPTDVLDQVFAVDGPEVAPSGRLLDRVLQLARVIELDGAPDAPVVSTSRWRQALHELRRASADPGALPEWKTLRESADAMPREVIPVARLDLLYDRLSDRAVENGEVRSEGGSLRFGSEALESRRVFAAAALRPRTTRGRAVEFDFDERWSFSDREVRVVETYFDAGDGLGLREIPSEGRVRVQYGREGSRALHLEQVFEDGTRAQARFSFDVVALVTPAPHDTLQFTATMPYDGIAARGTAYFYYAPDRTDPNPLQPPVVLVEGFDLDNSLGWDEIYALLNEQNLLEDLRTVGHDLVVLDFEDATAPIQRNSQLVVDLLLEVQQRIHPSAKIVLAGASMGALCARYAMLWMEAEGLDPRVSTYLSFDGPHGGANIPLGLQHWLEFFSGESADAAFLLERLDRPAARQLLLTHHSDPATSPPGPDPLRGQFLADLDSLGGYPTTARMVAIANGSVGGVDQGYAAGEQILRWQYDSFLVDIRGNVWAVPGLALQRIFEGRIDILLLGSTTEDVFVSSALPLDNGPGGWRASLAQADSTAAPYGDIVALYPNHCFIPTVSAIDHPSADPFHDLTGDGDLSAVSPFDVVHVPTENQEHVAITPQNAAWIRDAIASSPTAAGAVASLIAILGQNAPNPFNPRTTISLEVFTKGMARIDVFDVRGQRVDTILDAVLDPGIHSVLWNGLDSLGRPVGSGVYFYRLRMADGVWSRRMLLLK